MGKDGENFVNKIWCVIMMTTCMISLLSDGKATAAALLQSGDAAVQLVLTLTGSMVLWSGLMEILAATGDVDRMGRILRRMLAPLFPGLKDDACWAAMGMNLSANIMGLGNAATPAGIRAATLLEKQGEAGARALAMLLVLNNSGLQLMPTTVITLRSAAGAAQPADIWLPTLAASAAATLCGGVLMWLVNRGGAHCG